PEDDPPEEQPEPPRPSLNVSLSNLQADRATVAINSDQCVAVRYEITGSDGSSGADRSSGWANPTGDCKRRWTAALPLNPDTQYEMTVWVKAENTEKTRRSRLTFTTPE
ncbi:MAG: hypothetical protein AAF547_05400, partial [Actinomycetota bacterium]